MNDTINRYLAILCYPFASLQFFQEDLLEKIFIEKQERIRQKLTEKLKYEVVQFMKQYYNIYSYDEVYLYLEKCYLYDLFNSKNENILQVYLQKFEEIMKTMISQRDGRIVFKYWSTGQDTNILGDFGEENKIFLYHSMNMHIPLDFFSMLYIVSNPQNDVYCLNYYYGHIEVADQQLDGILKQGVAENHLHKGVSLSFLEIWERLMQPVRPELVKILEVNELGLSYSGTEENEMLFYIFSAGIVRLFLSLEIMDINIEQFSGKGMEIYQSFSDGGCLKDIYLKVATYEKKEQRHVLTTYFLGIWEEILANLGSIKEGTSILRSIFGINKKLYTSDENIFLFYAIKYYISSCSESMDVHKMKIIKTFMQYLRIRNVLFNCLVQKKTIRGLDYFQKEFYSKNSKINKLVGCETNSKDGEVIYWEQAMRKQFQNKYLKKIEFRTSIDDKELKFRKSIKNFLKAYRNVIREDYCILENGKYKVHTSFPRIGLVMHLLKKKDISVPNKCVKDGIEDNISRIQFGELEEVYNRQINNLKNLRDAIPGLDQYIVGLDAASLENSTPVWVFKEAFDKARDGSCEKIGYGNEIKDKGRQSLRFTFHAGEDFRHLLSGLRRIDEVMTFLRFHAGDRIGHGTVLGIDAEEWKRLNPFIVIPQEEALQNYIWAYYMLSKNDIDFQSTVMAYIERRVEDLTKKIYGGTQGITMFTLIEGYKKMFLLSTVEHLKSCINSNDINFCNYVQNEKYGDIVWNSEKIVLANHCKKFLVEMERPIHYEITEQDIIITKTLQQILKRKLSVKGIVVEVNPTSNISIGEVDKITDNQIYRLNSVDNTENVMVCVNSDDPTVFNTNVSNELAYIYYGMLKKVKSREIALQWIDKIRKYGIDASFIQSMESDQKVYDCLEEIIERM